MPNRWRVQHSDFPGLNNLLANLAAFLSRDTLMMLRGFERYRAAMLPTTTRKDLNVPGLIWTDPERMSGAPCFYGSRVPIKNLFDYIEGGHTIDDFLDGFEGVTREQVVGVLELARRGLLEERSAA